MGKQRLQTDDRNQTIYVNKCGATFTATDTSSLTLPLTVNGTCDVMQHIAKDLHSKHLVRNKYYDIGAAILDNHRNQVSGTGYLSRPQILVHIKHDIIFQVNRDTLHDHTFKQSKKWLFSIHQVQRSKIGN